MFCANSEEVRTLESNEGSRPSVKVCPVVAFWTHDSTPLVQTWFRFSPVGKACIGPGSALCMSTHRREQDGKIQPQAPLVVMTSSHVSVATRGNSELDRDPSETHCVLIRLRGRSRTCFSWIMRICWKPRKHNSGVFRFCLSFFHFSSRSSSAEGPASSWCFVLELYIVALLAGMQCSVLPWCPLHTSTKDYIFRSTYFAVGPCRRQVSCVFSRMRSEGFSFNSGGLGVEPCSRPVVSMFATVRNRSQPFAVER